MQKSNRGKRWWIIAPSTLFPRVAINDGKTKIVTTWHGVEFLGAYVKPYRQYASRPMVSRMREKLRHLPWENREKVMASLQSYEGLLSHGMNYRLWQKIQYHLPF